MKMQYHARDCLCYYCYMVSPEWEREKKKAFQEYRHTYCIICKVHGTEWHHYKGYEAIWTEEDYKYIVLVCRNCHQRCHFRLRDNKKIPLEKRDLFRRYKFVKRTHKIRTFRPSHFFEFVAQVYGV